MLSELARDHLNLGLKSASCRLRPTDSQWPGLRRAPIAMRRLLRQHERHVNGEAGRALCAKNTTGRTTRQTNLNLAWWLSSRPLEAAALNLKAQQPGGTQLIVATFQWARYPPPPL